MSLYVGQPNSHIREDIILNVHFNVQWYLSPTLKVFKFTLHSKRICSKDYNEAVRMQGSPVPTLVRPKTHKLVHLYESRSFRRRKMRLFKKIIFECIRTELQLYNFNLALALLLLLLLLFHFRAINCSGNYEKHHR